MKKQPINNLYKYSIFLMLGLFSCIVINIIPASVIAVNQNEILAHNIPINVPSNFLIDEKYMYTFKVSDKLKGIGDIKLIIENNQIKGIASGIGKTAQCQVSFNTNIQGSFHNPKKDIEVAINGIGDPIGIPIPGKITFQGPLKGVIGRDKLSFSGKVHIKGRLAKFAGFKTEEEILIEIPNINVSRTFNPSSNNNLTKI